MSLLNHTLKYLAFALLIIISVWAVIFYINMLDEVYDSLDDGLDNYKMLIIEKAHQDSTIIYHNEFAEGNYKIREIDKTYAKSIRDVHQDTLMYMPFEEDMEPVRLLTTAFKLNGRYYELKVITSMVEEDDLIEDLFYALIWLYIAMLMSILLVNNFLLKKVWKPFYSLVDQLGAFRLAKGKKFEPVETNVKEFRILNESVSGLVKHSLDTYNHQKQFIENASHELQTPVAISINRLELLAEKGNLGEETMESISQVIQTLERLTRLNKSLLLLSKIENRQFEDIEPISMNALVGQVKGEFEDFAEFKNVTIEIQEQGEMHVMMQKDLATILISNLIKNAIVHNHSGGRVQVSVGNTYLKVANTGTDIPLDEEKVFRRFQKDSSDKNNTGLGLSIVKAIVDLYGLNLVYEFDGMHVIKIIKAS